MKIDPNEEEEELTNEQFLIWLENYSKDVEEASRKYWENQKNNQNSINKASE
jgi:hypothetical protein